MLLVLKYSTISEVLCLWRTFVWSYMPAGAGKDQQLLSPGEVLGVLMDEKVSKGKHLVPSVKRTIVQLTCESSRHTAG